MSTHKNFDKICIAVLAAAILLTVLFMNGSALGIETIVDEDAETYSGSAYFTTKDLDGSWDVDNAVKIVLEGPGGKISGDGAYFLDGDLIIASGGYYVISGTLEEGSIIVNAYDSSKVFIGLDGVEISCSDDACIQVDQADKVFLTLLEGSQNTLTSGESYSETALSDGTDGVIFAHDDLTINGSGSLTVEGGYKHGIVGNDDLVITGGMITVTAPKDGIRANDSVRITGADLTVTAGDDGIVADEETSYLYIESGTVRIQSEDDAIHTAGDIIIEGGSFTIDAADDGIHSDTDITVSDGTILINSCYEGIEGANITISGGDITVYPTDDGLNATNGSSSGFGFGGMGFGGMGSTDSNSEETMESGSGTDADPVIEINGGTLTILNENGRDADGIDSNGDIIINGGTVLVSLGNSGGNNALDYGSENGGSCFINGGVVAACASSSMLEEVSAESGQNVITMLGTEFEAGTSVSIYDEEGTELYTWEIPCSFSAAVLSIPELESGKVYTVTAGESSDEVTLEETVTTVGDAASGFGTAGGFGGGMDDNMAGGAQGGMGGNMAGGARGGRGGFGNHGMGDQTTGSADSTDSSEMTGMPDMTGMPEMGEMPDMTGMPEMGEMPGGGQMDQDGQMWGEQRQAAEEEEEDGTEASDSRKSLSEFGTETWGWLIASVLILVLALIFTKIYRVRRY